MTAFYPNYVFMRCVINFIKGIALIHPQIVNVSVYTYCSLGCPEFLRSDDLTNHKIFIQLEQFRIFL